MIVVDRVNELKQAIQLGDKSAEQELNTIMVRSKKHNHLKRMQQIQKIREKAKALYKGGEL